MAAQSPHPLTSEEQNDIRRASKARRRHGSSRKNQGTPNGQTILDLVREDRQVATRAAAEERAQRTDQQVRFRQLQVNQAREHQAYTGLGKNSVARTLADAVLDVFPTATPSQGVGRTAYAIDCALTRLSLTHTTDESKLRAIRFGRKAVYTALAAGYEQALKLQLAREYDKDLETA